MEEIVASLGLIVAIILIWTLLVRSFPDILSRGIVKHIEHKYDAKLESIKAEMQASISTMQSSVDFLGVSQSEYRGKVIASIDCLWLSIQSCRNAYSNIMFLHGILTPDEIRYCIEKNDSTRFRHILEEYRDVSFVTEKNKEIEQHLTGTEILYVGSRIWILYRAILLVNGRAAILLNQSIDKKKYQDWRQDKHLLSAIGDILPEEHILNARGKTIGGLNDILDWIIAEFIKEGSDLLQGSVQLEESVSRIYSVLKKTAQQPSDN